MICKPPLNSSFKHFYITQNRFLVNPSGLRQSNFHKEVKVLSLEIENANLC
jgi:hypothetical protein